MEELKKDEVVEVANEVVKDVVAKGNKIVLGKKGTAAIMMLTGIGVVATVTQAAKLVKKVFNAAGKKMITVNNTESEESEEPEEK